jgi:tagatose 1,6-diphosphate aldolase
LLNYVQRRADMTTFGKYRHLAQCSTAGGHFTILAIDHRDNLLNSLNQVGSQPLTADQFSAFKQQVMRHLLPVSSAVLADPAFGFGPGVSSGTISGQVGFLSPLEETDYTSHPSQRATNFIQGWSVAKIKRCGGSGVKLLLYYHPGAANAQAQQDLVARVVEDCAKHDIPLFVEPIAYSLDTAKSLDNAELRQIVVQSALTFSTMGIDVLKVEFPLDVKREPDESVWRAALADLNAACSVPWALLSAGTDYTTFKRQVQLACEAGASGVMAGRAIWSEAVSLRDAERDQFLAETACHRMQELSAICAAYGTSWREKVSAPIVDSTWHERYEG